MSLSDETDNDHFSLANTFGSRESRRAFGARGYLMAEPGVEVAWDALNRHLRRSRYTELWWQFRPRGSKDVLSAVEAAVEVANEVVKDAGWGHEVFTEWVADCSTGPVAWMSRCRPEDGVRAWFAAFAEHLVRLGKAGKVTTARQTNFPRWFGDEPLPMQLTAFVSYRTNDLSGLEGRERETRWHVPAAVTKELVDAATVWGRFDGADVYLGRGYGEIRTKNPDVGRPLAQAVIKWGHAGVTYLRSEPPRVATLNLNRQGQACYTVLDDTVPWQDRLEQVTAAMVALPEDTDLAFVQYTSAYAVSWMELQVVRPALPYVEEPDIRYNRHLNSRYIPDAHGLQLLTDAHLEHASDLSDWVIEPLGGGRHLVQAKDLQPWYANIDPDPQTLAKARADFGKMILTKQTIADNPFPGSSRAIALADTPNAAGSWPSSAAAELFAVEDPQTGMPGDHEELPDQASGRLVQCRQGLRLDPKCLRRAEGFGGRSELVYGSPGGG